MKIRISPILVVLLMLLSAILFSCGENAANGDNENDGNTVNTEINDANAQVDSGDTEQTTEKMLPDLPESNFGGYKFRIVSNGTDHNVHWYARDIYAEAETGDTINDAVYKRNTAIEEKYNFEIVDLPQASPDTFARKSLRSGSDDFDLISTRLSSYNVPFGIEGYLCDLNQLNYIDLDKPWWDQSARQSLSLAGSLFTTINDFTIMDKDATWVIMFNKKLINDFALEDPYALVRSGKWTMDKMYDMMKSVAKDLDGDGTMDDTDQYGLVTEDSNMMMFYTGAEEAIILKDEKDYPYINFVMNDKSIDVIAKAYEMQSNTNYTISANKWLTKYPNDTVWDGMQLVIFDTNRSLFYYSGMNRVTLLRSMETDFGILPSPKYNEQQENYYCGVSTGCASSIAIPVTVSDVDRTCIILEALTAESYYTLRPAYYEISLKSKLARDEESAEMLDLIFANRAYDLGWMYGWGGLAAILTEMPANNKTDVISQFEKKENVAIRDMEKAMTKIEAIE